MKMFVAWLFSIISLSSVVYSQPATKDFTPGKPWYDIKGRAIEAHHGFVQRFGDMYYWYGDQSTTEKENSRPTGINCYRSRDLISWENIGVVYRSSQGCNTPRVIYNPVSQQYLLWMALMYKDDNQIGVAASTQPTGPFQLQQTYPINSQLAGNFTLLEDGSNRGYLFYTVNDSMIAVRQLSKDYTALLAPMLIKLERRATGSPVVFKKGPNYYMISASGQGKTIWSVAREINGKWRSLETPFEGPGFETGCNSRPSCVLSLKREDITMLYIGDRWDPGQSSAATYVWLPMGINEEGMMEIPWQDRWHFFK